jgi:hypothetical protein
MFQECCGKRRIPPGAVESNIVRLRRIDDQRTLPGRVDAAEPAIGRRAAAARELVEKGIVATGVKN